MIPRSLIFALLLVAPAAAQDTHYPPEGNQIPGPGQMPPQPQWVTDLLQFRATSPSSYLNWLDDLKQWRHERLIRMGYNDAEYRRPELLWTQKNFVSPQAMVEDRYFYDPARRVYTVDRFLDDLDTPLWRHR